MATSGPTAHRATRPAAGNGRGCAFSCVRHRPRVVYKTPSFRLRPECGFFLPLIPGTGLKTMARPSVRQGVSVRVAVAERDSIVHDPRVAAFRSGSRRCSLRTTSCGGGDRNTTVVPGQLRHPPRPPAQRRWLPPLLPPHRALRGRRVHRGCGGGGGYRRSGRTSPPPPRRPESGSCRGECWCRRENTVELESRPEGENTTKQAAAAVVLALADPHHRLPRATAKAASSRSRKATSRRPAGSSGGGPTNAGKLRELAVRWALLFRIWIFRRPASLCAPLRQRDLCSFRPPPPPHQLFLLSSACELLVI